MSDEPFKPDQIGRADDESGRLAIAAARQQAQIAHALWNEHHPGKPFPPFASRYFIAYFDVAWSLTDGCSTPEDGGGKSDYVRLHEDAGYRGPNFKEPESNDWPDNPEAPTFLGDDGP